MKGAARSTLNAARTPAFRRPRGGVGQPDAAFATDRLAPANVTHRTCAKQRTRRAVLIKGLHSCTFPAQPKPFWSHLPVCPCLIDWGGIVHPTYPTKCAYHTLIRKLDKCKPWFLWDRALGGRGRGGDGRSGSGGAPRQSFLIFKAHGVEVTGDGLVREARARAKCDGRIAVSGETTRAGEVSGTAGKGAKDKAPCKMAKGTTD
jgi:hypothetical protein